MIFRISRASPTEDGRRVLHGRRRRSGGAVGRPTKPAAADVDLGLGQRLPSAVEPRRALVISIDVARPSRDALRQSRADAPEKSYPAESVPRIGLEPARADVLCGGGRGPLLLHF